MQSVGEGEGGSNHDYGLVCSSQGGRAAERVKGRAAVIMIMGCACARGGGRLSVWQWGRGEDIHTGLVVCIEGPVYLGLVVHACAENVMTLTRTKLKKKVFQALVSLRKNAALIQKWSHADLTATLDELQHVIEQCNTTDVDDVDKQLDADIAKELRVLQKMCHSKK